MFALAEVFQMFAQRTNCLVWFLETRSGSVDDRIENDIVNRAETGSRTDIGSEKRIIRQTIP